MYFNTADFLTFAIPFIGVANIISMLFVAIHNLWHILKGCILERFHVITELETLIRKIPVCLVDSVVTHQIRATLQSNLFNLTLRAPYHPVQNLRPLPTPKSMRQSFLHQLLMRLLHLLPIRVFVLSHLSFPLLGHHLPLHCLEILHRRL